MKVIPYSYKRPHLRPDHPIKLHLEHLGKKAHEQKKLQLIRPMLAEMNDSAFDHPDWIFETKYNGYRALANIENGNVNVYSRRLLSFNESYTSIVNELKNISHNAILDGELVVENEHGRSGFQLLQQFNPETDTLKYYVFDITHLNGYDLCDLPLISRKELLKMLLDHARMKNVIYCGHIKEHGTKLFKQAKENGLEGIIAKFALGKYEPAKRSREWLKIKNYPQQEAVIAGFTAPTEKRSYFNSIILAVRSQDKWINVGSCTAGITEKMLEKLYLMLMPHFTSQPPFKDKFISDSKVQWVKPKIVCEIQFSEWTKENTMKNPVFLGIRKDKTAKDVLMEKQK